MSTLHINGFSLTYKVEEKGLSPASAYALAVKAQEDGNTVQLNFVAPVLRTGHTIEMSFRIDSTTRLHLDRTPDDKVMPAEVLRSSYEGAISSDEGYSVTAWGLAVTHAGRQLVSIPEAEDADDNL